MGYLTGFLEGFTGRRNEVHAEELKLDEARRAQEGRLYEHLLASRDPEIRALALQGLFESAQPSGKKKGLRGYLGELQGSSVFPQIQALANQLVPDEPTPHQGPAAPAIPGGAAMSTNTPVQHGSTPIASPGMPTERISEPTFMPPPAEPEPGQPPTPAMDTMGMMGPPMESKFKRRGTQVPTAEEIAEYQARIPLQTKIGMAQQFLPPDLAQKATMGILGAPQSNRNLSAVSQWGVRLQPGGPVLPVLLDQTGGGYTLSDGTPVPPTAEMVRMSGGTGQGGITATVRDSPEVRTQYGIPPEEKTPTGYWKIKQNPDGSSIFIASEFVPPPTFSGTTTILDDSGNPIRAGVPRSGGAPVPIGDAPEAGPTVVQTDAQGLLAAVDKIITAETNTVLGRKPTPARMDQIVKEQAGKLGMPYVTYAELQRAAKSRPVQTPRERREQTVNPGMSMVDRVRQRALQNMQQGTRPSPVATPPPAQPSARAVGPGSRR